LGVYEAGQQLYDAFKATLTDRKYSLNCTRQLVGLGRWLIANKELIKDKPPFTVTEGLCLRADTLAKLSAAKKRKQLAADKDWNADQEVCDADNLTASAAAEEPAEAAKETPAQTAATRRAGTGKGGKGARASQPKRPKRPRKTIRPQRLLRLQWVAKTPPPTKKRKTQRRRHRHRGGDPKRKPIASTSTRPSPFVCPSSCSRRASSPSTATWPRIGVRSLEERGITRWLTCNSI
jgi:hypothetical protein